MLHEQFFLLRHYVNESRHKGVNQRSKYVTQVVQQRLELPTVTLTWHACKYNVHKLHQRYILKEKSKEKSSEKNRLFEKELYLWWTEFIYLVFTRMPGESYRR